MSKTTDKTWKTRGARLYLLPPYALRSRTTDRLGLQAQAQAQITTAVIMHSEMSFVIVSAQQAAVEGSGIVLGAEVTAS